MELASLRIALSIQIVKGSVILRLPTSNDDLDSGGEDERHDYRREAPSIIIGSAIFSP